MNVMFGEVWVYLCAYTFLFLIAEARRMIKLHSLVNEMRFLDLYLSNRSVFLKSQWRWLAISKDMNVNEKIRAREVRLIDSNGDQLGVKSKKRSIRNS